MKVRKLLREMALERARELMKQSEFVSDKAARSVLQAMAVAEQAAADVLTEPD